MVQVRFRRANRPAEDAGDLFMRQLVIRPEDQRGALFLRQLCDGAPYSRRPLLAQERVVR